MMAHYQNTERLQGLLKKHQSKNSPTSHWFLYFLGWNLEGLLCSDWPSPAPEYTLLTTGSQRLLTCIPSHRLQGTSFTLFSGPVFNIFFCFALLTIKRQRRCCWQASHMNPGPHHRSSSPARPAAFSITEVASTELLRPSSSSIDRHSWRPTSHWAVQRPQKTRPEASGSSKLFWETLHQGSYCFVQ